jgi:hypothetical protein
MKFNFITSAYLPTNAVCLNVYVTDDGFSKKFIIIIIY